MWFWIQASTKYVNESVAKQIHEKAAPVVAWLRTAEEESEEEEEDEVEVVYSESAGAKGITTVTEKPTQPAEEVCQRGGERESKCGSWILCTLKVVEVYTSIV